MDQRIQALWDRGRCPKQCMESRAVNSNLGDSKSETEVNERTHTRKLTAKGKFLVMENLRN